MENRCRILEAAIKVFAELGFRGATTRRIAEAAGVNEVTLFRTFGSKETLIAEALRHHATSAQSFHALPERPVDPERELTAWATVQLAELNAHRVLVRRTLGELQARPDLVPCVTAGWAANDQVVHGYLRRLRDAGFTDPSLTADELLAAGGMLLNALFSDAMGREMMPDLYPQPADRAPVMYVRLFLRAIGCRAVASEGDGDPAVLDAPTADARPADARPAARVAAGRRRVASSTLPSSP